jgi:hypothetical protein
MPVPSHGEGIAGDVGGLSQAKKFDTLMSIKNQSSFYLVGRMHEQQ